MIVFDEDTEAHLKHFINVFRLESDTGAALRFVLSKDPALKSKAPEIQQMLIEKIKHLPEIYHPHLFLCDDGDIFILAYSIPDRAAHQIVREIGEIYEVENFDEFALSYDLINHQHKLQTLVNEKLEVIRLVHEDEIMRKKLEAAERKRTAILNSDKFCTSEMVGQKRAKRDVPELMIIEDDPFSRKLVENILPKHYAVTSLSNAEAAFITYAKIEPDILFLDINLPNVTGHELLERILRLDPDAYVIMISGNSDRENIMQAMKLGAKGFVAKPFTRDKLLQYIERCPTIKNRVIH